LKSVHICQSYRKNKMGPFLWPTVYIVHNIKHVLRLALASHGVIFDTALRLLNDISRDAAGGG